MAFTTTAGTGCHLSVTRSASIALERSTVPASAVSDSKGGHPTTALLHRLPMETPLVRCFVH